MNGLKVEVGRGRFSESNLGLSSQKVGNLCRGTRVCTWGFSHAILMFWLLGRSLVCTCVSKWWSGVTAYLYQTQCDPPVVSDWAARWFWPHGGCGHWTLPLPTPPGVPWGRGWRRFGGWMIWGNNRIAIILTNIVIAIYFLVLMFCIIH